MQEPMLEPMLEQVVPQSNVQLPTVAQLMHLQEFLNFLDGEMIEILYINDIFAILDEYLQEGYLNPIHHIHVIDTINLFMDDVTNGITFGPV